MASISVNQSTAKEFVQKYIAVIDSFYFNKIEDLIIGLAESIDIPVSVVKEWEEKKEQLKKYNNRLSATSKLNNLGISAENKGDIDKAIEYYEKNIKQGCIATHSFDRLIVLYRKHKKYEDELRIIDNAVEVFSEENLRRFKKAVVDPSNKKYISEIELAMEQNITLKNDEGFYIFEPYELLKLISRRDKVEKKLLKTLQKPVNDIVNSYQKQNVKTNF